MNAMCELGEHEQERWHHGIAVQPAVTGRRNDSQSLTGNQRQATGAA